VSDIFISLASGFAHRIGVEIAEKSIPIVKKHLKSTTKKTLETIEYTSGKTLEIIDEGWLKDYYAGGISKQFNKNNTESA
jgi:hypothetical protein